MNDDLDRAFAGMDGIAVAAEVRAAARSALEAWWNDPRLAAYRAVIAGLVARGRFDELVDAFRQVVPFGTGGRRGAVGVGPNRINPFTVAASVQGHADWLIATAGGAARPAGLVLAYDVRRFEDVRGVYGGVPSPIDGLTSRDLAELAARVYAANGFTVHLLAERTRYLSTPELSFTIRALGAAGGLNVSASHNPPDDNGVKVYDARGGQLVPPDDQALLDVVGAVGQVHELAWDDAVASGRIRWLGLELHQAYLDAVSGVAGPGPRGLGLLYTPLHGTGVVHEALAAAGFTCALHEPQATRDGAFPTVPGGVANPEVPAVMAHALAAAAPDVDLVIGTDPDADRLGIEVRHQGAWVHLTGNDIAALVADAAVARASGDGRQPLVVVTEVTSALVGRVARAGGAAVVDDLLVGFKYVAEGLAALERDGAWRGLRASGIRFVAGAEESHGVLVTDRIRDKDAAGGAVLVAAVAAEAKLRGETLVDVLHRLQHAHGYVLDDQVSIAYAGASGPGRLAALLDGLRASPPTALGGRRVTSAVDHRDEGGRFGAFVSPSDRAARNVLVYHLAADPGANDDGARVILRPSGTEPKLKAYVEVLGRPGLDDAGRERVRASIASLCAAVRAALA